MFLRDAREGYPDYQSIAFIRTPFNDDECSSALTESETEATVPDGAASEEKVVEGQQIGVVSAIFIIFNRIIGTGNGGEKNYLEYLFHKPKYLITSMYASNGVLLGT
ncbi:hypothetical protein C0992_007371 [Termitomyces sp. T32_za158]|nr:hypothetical protein C0992_007371 [Termitomyces sp. T32_za158]